MAEVRTASLTKSYGDLRAVDEVDLVIDDGEFFTLLGPSGCGKSTLLGMLAGLEVPTSGLIEVGGRVLYSSEEGIFVPPEQRNGGLVFQSYALWPHMTVYQNLAFALKLRSIKGRTQRSKIAQALDLVEMGDYADRYPHELSGGQQQRVALSRTLVYEPELLLLDEPLSNLDAILRDKARVWLRELHDAVGVTTVYVTHDQGEALALSDRIAVLQAGRVLQVAEPVELYENPAALAVAEFIGTTDILECTVTRAGSMDVDLSIDEAPDSAIALPMSCFVGVPREGSTVRVVLRPDWIRVVGSADDSRSSRQFRASLVSSSYLGGYWQHLLRVGECSFRSDSSEPARPGDVDVVLNGERVRAFVETADAE